MKVLGILLDIVHLLLVFLPIIIYFIPIKFIKNSFKYIFLLLILIPVHWELFNNKCVFTLMAKKLGSYDDMDIEGESLFSRKYLRWLYEPIMKIIGWEWTEENVSKMAVLHWIVNFILLWNYLFFVGGKNLI